MNRKSNIEEDIKLSVIIPVYNAGSYLDRCLYRLINQLSGDEVEVIAVDDGSTDDSGTKLDEYAERYEFIKVIHQKNAGPAAARNVGLSVARGVWIWFIDPDDYPDEDAVGKLIEAAGKHETSDVMIFDAYEHMTAGMVNLKQTSDRVLLWEHFDADWEMQVTDESCHDENRKLAYMLQRAVLYPNEIRTGFICYDKMGDIHPAGRTVPLAAPWDKAYRRGFLVNNDICFDQELRVLDDMFFNVEVFGAAKGIAYIKEKVYHYVRNLDSITSSYTAGRVGKDLDVWRAVNGYMDKLGSDRNLYGYSESDIYKLKHAYYKRVIRSYAICCKRSIFHPDNPMKRLARIRYAAKVMKMPEYKEAFCGVRISELEWRLKPVAVFGRLKFGFGMYILSLLENSRT